MRPLLLTAAIALLLATPVVASAADFKNGDVFVGTSTGQYNVYDNGGTLLETIDQAAGGAQAVDCAFDRSGVLYTTAFGAARVVRFLGPGAAHQARARSRRAPRRSPSASPATAASTSATRRTRTRCAGSAAPGRRSPAFSPARPAALIDLSADQRTVFYTDRTSPDAAGRPPLRRRGRRGPPRLRGPRRHGPHRRPQAARAGRRQRRRDRRADDDDQARRTGTATSSPPTTGRARTRGSASRSTPTGSRSGPRPQPRATSTASTSPRGAVDRGPLASAASAFGICVKGTRTAAIDNAAPSISISAPAEGATFQQGQEVKASFACAGRRQRVRHQALHRHRSGRRVDRHRLTGDEDVQRGGGRQRGQHRDRVAHLHRRGTPAAAASAAARSSGSSSRCRATSRPSGGRSGSLASSSRTCPGAPKSPRRAGRSRAGAAGASGPSRSATRAAP